MTGIIQFSSFDRVSYIYIYVCMCVQWGTLVESNLLRTLGIVHFLPVLFNGITVCTLFFEYYSVRVSV